MTDIDQLYQRLQGDPAMLAKISRIIRQEQEQDVDAPHQPLPRREYYYDGEPVVGEPVRIYNCLGLYRNALVADVYRGGVVMAEVLGSPVLAWPLEYAWASNVGGHADADAQEADDEAGP